MRIGLLGTGPWAGMAHAPALSEHAGLDFVGVWGRRSDAAKELADRHGTRAYDDVDALLADVDAVAVALPPAVQADLAVRAARAGRHLLLDKPLATTVEQGRAVADAVREAQVASVVFFTSRFVPGTEAWITEQADAGAGSRGARSGWGRCSAATATARSRTRRGGRRRAARCGTWGRTPSPCCCRSSAMPVV